MVRHGRVGLPVTGLVGGRPGHRRRVRRHGRPDAAGHPRARLLLAAGGAREDRCVARGGVRVVGPDARDRPAGGRGGRGRPAGDAGGRQHRRAGGAVARRRRQRAGAGRRAVPALPLARGPAGGDGVRRDRDAHPGAGVLDADLPRRGADARSPGAADGAGDRHGGRRHRARAAAVVARRLDRQDRARGHHHPACRVRLRGRPQRHLRLRRPADPQPAAVPPAGGARHARRAERRRGDPLGRPRDDPERTHRAPPDRLRPGHVRLRFGASQLRG